MKKLVLATALTFALPYIAFAQGTLAPIQSLLVSVGNLISLAIPILIGAAIVVFFWGLLKYIRNPEHKDGVKTMIAGIASLFIMVSIWGIVHLAQSALLGTNPSQTILAPHFPQN